jgi:hypothetical protein
MDTKSSSGKARLILVVVGGRQTACGCAQSMWLCRFAAQLDSTRIDNIWLIVKRKQLCTTPDLEHNNESEPCTEVGS